uniref:Uncharacterized protein n=1 Tax=Onchocerca volvulus TaxID=6282 RepID=A0A8R1TV09_ONCVO
MHDMLPPFAETAIIRTHAIGSCNSQKYNITIDRSIALHTHLAPSLFIIKKAPQFRAQRKTKRIFDTSSTTQLPPPKGQTSTPRFRTYFQEVIA